MTMEANDMKDNDKIFKVSCGRCSHEVEVDLGRDAPDVEEAVDEFMEILKLWHSKGITENAGRDELGPRLEKDYEMYKGMMG